MFKRKGLFIKVKPPLFHFMESLHSIAILKKFEFLCQFSRPLKKIMFCFRTEVNTKSLFTTTSNVWPFKFKC